MQIRRLVIGVIVWLTWMGSLTGQDVVMFDSLVMETANIVNLHEINSTEMDFGPVYWKDLLVYVTNDRADLDVDRRINEKYFDLKYADENQTEGFERAAFFPEIINSPFHEGPCTFTSDGGVMYFTRDLQQRNKPVKNDNNIIPLQIYKSTLNQGGWSEPELWIHSKKDALYAHPTLSMTGDTLVFSSSRSGGQGKMDLYMSMREAGSWTDPIAINIINSKGSEWFARFYQGFLFYASDHGSRSGDLDIYIYDFKTQKNLRLPAPINTGYDDFGFAVIDDGTAVFSSNRPGGLGKDDLYQFNSELPMIRVIDPEPTYLTLNIKDNKTGSAVQGAEFEITTIQNQKDIITILLDNVESRELLRTKYFDGITTPSSNINGVSSVEIDFPVLVKIEGYVPGYQDYSSIHYLDSPEDLRIALIPERVVVPTPPPPAKRVIIQNTEVKKGTVLVFNNIYYVYNSAEIEPSSFSELDGLASAMVDNPTIKVQLSAHTDSRGESLYNQLLSDKRANSAKNYLVRKGVNPNRIVAIGFGESLLRNQCDNDINCTEEEHKFNRRTEVKILEY